ncbi:MAG: T9SS type A sorting domain-containing protein [Candidatus Cloacimonetes bacterium]|jgi:hypothetical protein|nr:T9SS type A sorting domain-containing protein [Candidatus Cloacimonadota bacterium]
MKKKLIIVLMVVLCGSLFAVSQNFVTAQKIVENFLNSKTFSKNIESYFELENTYVFQLKPTGFVAVSKDNDVFPILAYSFKNKWYQNDREKNILIKMLNDDIQLRLEHLPLSQKEKNREIWQQYLSNQINFDRPFQQWPTAGSTATDGWVETRWGQSGVYNQFCPLDDSGERSVVGCVATAMAMIIDYHEFVGDVSFDNSDDYYGGWSGEMHIDNDYEERDYPPFPELNVLLNDVADHYENGIELSGTNKAALSFACGVSVEMMYSSEGSGAWTAMVADALQNKFDFESATHYDNEGWDFYERLSANMMNMQPAEISIYTSGWQNGHAIICDGYNTDDYYHLNYGWGTSNSSCWYLLPEGMPSNYSIVSGGVMNIEGGAAPLHLYGNVAVNGTSPLGTYIKFEGDNYAEIYVENTNGNFEIPAIMEGLYTVTAFKNDRIYFQTQEIYISESNNFVQINLTEFDEVTGSVDAPIELFGANIAFYQDDELKYSGTANENGYYAIADILPGNYLATASWENYFETKSVTIDSQNMTVDFEMENYPADLALSYAKSEDGTYSLITNYTLTCAIKLTDAEFAEGDLFSKMRFKAPMNSNEGEITAQIWESNNLLSEKFVENYSAEEWVEVDFDNFIQIESGKEYYVGYRINSDTADLAFHDAGPRVIDKGAFLRTTTWINLNADNFNYNFCIEAVSISQNYGVLNGNLQLNGGDGEIENTVVKADHFSARPDVNGNFILFVKPGIYSVEFSLIDYETAILLDENVNQSENVELENVILNYAPASNDDAELEIANHKLHNYPNPFNLATTISFSLNNEQNGQAQIEIYNLKGQLVKTLPTTPNQEIIWNAENSPSGIYFYKLVVDGKVADTRKMILMK